MEDLQLAKVEFERALTLSPKVLDAYPEIVEVLHQLEELKEAKIWIEKAEKEGVKLGEINFLKGLVLVKEEKYSEAKKAFEKAKEFKPEIAQAANLQIALIQIREKRIKTALQTLRATISMAPETELAEFGKEYEKSLERLLKEYRAFRASIGVFYQYDNNPASADGVIVARSSDSSLISYLRGEYVPMLEGPWIANFYLGLQGQKYSRLDTLDNRMIYFSAVPGYNFSKGAFTFPVFYQKSWLDNREYSEIKTLRPTLSYVFLPGHILQTFLTYGDQKILRKALLPEENRDATLKAIGLSHFYPFKEGKGLFNLGFELGKSDTEGRNWEANFSRMMGVLVIPLPFRFSLSFSGELNSQNYQYTHTIFAKKRKDKTYNLGTTLNWQIYKHLTLSLQYSRVEVDSNIKIYDYKRDICSFGLEFRY